MLTDNIIYGNVVAFDRNARMTEAEYDAELTPWKRRAIREAFDVEQIFKIVGPASSVLIVGCGVGSQDPIVASYESVREVHAVDPAPKCVERAEQNFSHPKIRRWVAGYADLPDSHRYDLTFSVDVFEHVDRPDLFLRKMRGVVKPGGYVAVLTPNRLRWQNIALRLQGKPPVLLSVMHFKEYSRRELVDMAASEGLRYVSYFGEELYGPFIKLDAEASLRWGNRLRPLAHVIGVVFRS
jgi:2-polyprenyl-3-methyl-5-hydroxy-6-metoxy-1,4-benzoquinol methylase